MYRLGKELQVCDRSRRGERDLVDWAKARSLKVTGLPVGRTVTADQASVAGASRPDLSRLAKTGHLSRLAHGVYVDGGALSGLNDLSAACLSTDPKTLGAVRPS